MDWRDIPSEKFIDGRALASQFETRLSQANSAMREKLGSIPRIVEIAYVDRKWFTHFQGFGNSFEPIVQEVTGSAKRAGLVYEYDKLIYEDEKSGLRDMRDRLSALSADSSVDGVKISGWGMQGSSLHNVDWIDPRKDIDCSTVESDAWLLKRLDTFKWTEERGVSNWWLDGQGPLINPRVGSVLKALAHGLKAKPPSQSSVALVQHASKGPYDNYLLMLWAAALRGTDLTIYTDPGPQDAGRIHQADAIITRVENRGYLDGRYVRRGQVVIDPEGCDVDLDTVIPVIAAYANRTISALELKIEFLNAMRSFLLKHKEDGAHFYPLLDLLEQN